MGEHKTLSRLGLPVTTRVCETRFGVKGVTEYSSVSILGKKSRRITKGILNPTEGTNERRYFWVGEKKK